MRPHNMTNAVSSASSSYNEERFLFGGAAHGTPCEGSATGGRAGKQKTCWTKPLPQAARLWAFNGADPSGSARDRRFPFDTSAPFWMLIRFPGRRRRLYPALALSISTSTTRATQAPPSRYGGRFRLI